MPMLSAIDPTIHPDCEISNCTVGAFVEIGRGSRVSNTTFGDYSYCDRYADMIVAGVPAEPLRAHLSPELADRMIALAWWDWDHAHLRDALEDFRALPAKAFLEKYEP